MNDAQLVNLSVDNHCRKHYITMNQRSIFGLFFTKKNTAFRYFEKPVPVRTPEHLLYFSSNIPVLKLFP